MASRRLEDEAHEPRSSNNRRLVEYLVARLDARTSPGQCILHLAPHGEVKKIEWREVDLVDDILDG